MLRHITKPCDADSQMSYKHLEKFQSKYCHLGWPASLFLISVCLSNKKQKQKKKQLGLLEHRSLHLCVSRFSAELQLELSEMTSCQAQGAWHLYCSDESMYGTLPLGEY